MANGERVWGGPRVWALPAYSTCLASRAPRSRVNSGSYILGAKHWAKRSLQPGECGPLLSDEEASPVRPSAGPKSHSQ